MKALANKKIDICDEYKVKSGEMHRDGIVFYRSVNGVWLTKAVPVDYLDKLF